MDMGGDHCKAKEHTIDEKVGANAAQVEDCNRGKEKINENDT